MNRTEFLPLIQLVTENYWKISMSSSLQGSYQRQRKGQSYANKVFWVTFWAYAASHTIRMCYSFNKHHIQTVFALSDFHLGVLDAMMYLTYAFGTVIRYEIFSVDASQPWVYYLSSLLISVALSGVAWLSYFVEVGILENLTLAKILVTVSVMAIGFGHSTVFQNIAAIFGDVHDTYENGAKAGFWSSMSSVGNIVGFFFSNFMVYQLECKWQTTIFLACILNLAMSLVLYFSLDDPSQKAEDLRQLSEGQRMGVSFYFKFVKNLLREDSEYKLYTISFVIIKTLVYTLLMWLPIFFVSRGLAAFSGYIPMMVDVGGIIGGFLIGKLYSLSYSSNRQGSRGGSSSLLGLIANNRSFLATCFIVLVLLLYLTVSWQWVGWYFLLTLLLGLFLVGNYNVMSANEAFHFSDHSPLKIDMVTNFSITIGTTIIGTIQLIIAFLLLFQSSPSGPRQNQSSKYSVVFVVLIVLALVALITFCLRNKRSERKSVNEIE